MGAQPGQLGSIHLAASCSHAMGPHGSGAVRLSLWSGHRPQASNAGDAVQGDEQGQIYLCVAWALVFEGSVLAYNPARDEVEWVPVHSLANDLTWAEEKSAVALANYVLCIPQEAAQIVRLRACQLVSWPADSSTSEEEEEEQEEGEEQEEADPKLPSTDVELEQGEEEGEPEPSRPR